MPDFTGVRPWMRGLRSKITGSTAVLGAAEILVDDQGRVYGGDGATQIKNLSRLATEAQLATYVPRPVAGDVTGSVPTKQADGSIAYAVPTGGGVSVTDNTLGGISTSSSSVTDNNLGGIAA